MLLERGSIGTDDTTQNIKFRVFYKRLWNLKVANKIKITVCRIANDFIPTLSNLVNRRVAVRSYCLVCRGAEETVEHLFRECPVTVQVLRALGVHFSPTNYEHRWKCWFVKEFTNCTLNSSKL